MQQLAASHPDWPGMTALAGRQGVAPLLYKNLKSYASSSIPERSLSFLRDIYMHNAAANIKLQHELQQVVAALQICGISAIPFKGPALAEQAYSNLAWRKASVDLDIIVNKSDIAGAIKVLEDLGYHYSVHASSQHINKQIKYRYHLNFYKTGHAALELHWHIVPKYMQTFAIEEYLQRCAQVGAAPGLSFSNRDLFLLLCIHAAKDFWSTLSIVVDLHELGAKLTESDWTWLFNQSKQQGHERIIQVSLALIHRLFGTLFTQYEQNRKVDRIAARLIAALFAGQDRWNNKVDLIKFKYWLFFSIHERCRDKLRILWGKTLQLGDE